MKTAINSKGINTTPGETGLEVEGFFKMNGQMVPIEEIVVSLQGPSKETLLELINKLKIDLENTKNQLTALQQTVSKLSTKELETVAEVKKPNKPTKITNTSA
jgi:hypothetical protein